ncbi:MAG: hypothetical protein ACYS76_13000 [Planctomycetota bacterium]|jgi:hypothetical protein
MKTVGTTNVVIETNRAAYLNLFIIEPIIAYRQFLVFVDPDKTTVQTEMGHFTG